MTVALGTNIANPISTALSQWLGFDTMGKLSNYGKLGVTDPDAVIEALYANGEQGAWYDPSDLTTMFQDRAGTTPVTADGQTVGLILDKSKGLVLGAERMPNPVTGSVSGSWLVTSGVITRNGSASGQASCTTSGPATLEASKIFLVSFNVADLSGDTFFVRVGGGAAVQVTANGQFTLRITGNGGTNIIFAPWAGTAGQATITDLTVKEIAGNHAVAPSDAARPLYKVTGLAKWNDFDAVDDVLNTTFPSSLGSSCTVARANVGSAATILTAQTIGTSYANSTDNAGLVITNDALTPQETADLTAWLTAKGATS